MDDVGGAVVGAACEGGSVEAMHSLDKWCGNFDMSYSNCGAGTASVLYHVVFFTISAYMLLNLMVAIVLDNGTPTDIITRIDLIDHISQVSGKRS